MARKTLQEATEEYFDGPAQDTMSLDEFLLKKYGLNRDPIVRIPDDDDIKPDIVKRSMGSPRTGERAPLMNATADRAGTMQISRGAGAALRGIKFKGIS